MKTCALFLSVSLALLPLMSRGQPLDDAKIQSVEFEQKLGATLPLNLVFRDEKGASVRLGSYFGERPVIVVFAYFSCPNLCHAVLNGTVETLRQLKWTVGQQYDVIVVSIDPRETVPTAEAWQHKFSQRYGRPGSSSGWHFLNGDAEPIRALTDAAGFHYFYDEASQQYAHASGFLIATPDGHVSRYFLGIEYPAKEVRTALADAGQQRIGSLTERLLLFCFHYSPNHGKYGALITRAVQFGGIGTVGALGLLLVRLQRRAAARP